MKQKIVIIGGTGFIGRYLAERFLLQGFTVCIISRRAGTHRWSNEVEVLSALEEAEIVINLAGRSVDCRYNARNKEEILQSRVESTTRLRELITRCKTPPRLWLNASTATIYRHSEDRPMGESMGEVGSGFSVDVAKAWEEAFFKNELPTTRRVAMRISIVLGHGGGALLPFTRMVKLGLGGKQGSGNQMFSWVHIADVYNVVQFIAQNRHITGAINLTAPQPLPNAVVMETFRSALCMPVGLPAPAWILQIGAMLIGTEAELLLKSRWVVPERLLTAGFTFEFPTLACALENLYGQ